MGLYHLLIARRNPALKEFRWFGWFALALAVYSFEGSQWRYSLDISYLLHKKIEFFSLYIGGFFLCHTLRRVANLPSNLFWRAFQVMFLGYATLIVVVPNLDIHYLIQPSFELLGTTWIAGTAILMGWHGYQGNREARAIVGLMLLFFFGILNDVILPQGFLGGINVLSFVFALVILLMAVLMANHYTATLITLERTVEEHTADLRSANTQLQAATAAKSQFLANMSHELRTPMNAIIGLTHLGLKTELSEQQRNYLTSVENSAQGLMGIIESILDFSRLEQGSLELAEETFSVADVIAQVVAISAPTAEQRGLQLDSHLDASIPTQLRGDATHLRQILTIFTSNALKFTQQGEIQLSVKALAKDSQQCTLRFAVTDSGAGISAEQHDQLFEAFSQADDSHTREHGGTGLGLALARDLVHLMQSEIEVESEVGKGSTFSFTLQLAYLEATAALTDALDLTPIRGARVLLVDDSNINLQVAGELLRQEQLNFDCAENGQQAVDMVRESAYDCVLMDIQMPVLDGYAATEQIRSEARFQDLPILAMTANALPEDRARAKQAGMNAHIAKPIDPAELYRQLLIWIEPGEREVVTADPSQEAGGETDLPNELPGLAIDEGVARVGGNHKLYLSLLADMSKQYADVGDLFEQLISGGDTEDAVQLAHKLRGIANNLGATVVGGYAEQIELTLRAGETLAPSLLVSLQKALAQLLTSIAQLQPLAESSASSAEALGHDELAALLTQLKQEISESNPAAGDTIDAILPRLESASDAVATLNNIKDALDIYDFASAGDHLRTLT